MHLPSQDFKSEPDLELMRQMAARISDNFVATSGPMSLSCFDGETRAELQKDVGALFIDTHACCRRTSVRYL